MTLMLNVPFAEPPSGIPGPTLEWTAPVVVQRPELKNLTEVRFAECNHEVQAFPARTADQTFIVGIGLRRLVGD